MKENFYRQFISKRSHLIDLNVENFLNEEERFFIWNQPRISQTDIHGREPTIFKLQTPQITNFFEKKLRRPYLKYHNFIVDNICLLKLEKPTKPHIDGHYPVAERYGKKYCATKTLITPIAFETELQDSERIETSLVTFKQHYNHFINGGLEFDILYSQNKKYKDFNFEDSKNNILEKHENCFLTEENKDRFKHISHQFNGVLTYGLDLENIFDMKLGTAVAINPFQMHCTTTYDETFTNKWVLRLLICEQIR